jgi:hypothetical protein
MTLTLQMQEQELQLSTFNLIPSRQTFSYHFLSLAMYAYRSGH